MPGQKPGTPLGIFTDSTGFFLPRNVLENPSHCGRCQPPSKHLFSSLPISVLCDLPVFTLKSFLPLVKQKG